MSIKARHIDIWFAWKTPNLSMHHLLKHINHISNNTTCTSPWSHGWKFIRILHKCEVGIEKSVPRITDWHHEACRVMTNGDRERQIFLSHPHTNNGFFFLLTTKYLILNWKKMKKTSRKSWIPWDVMWWPHFNITMTSRIDVWPACSWQAAVFLSFPRAGTGMWDRKSYLTLVKYWKSRSGVENKSILHMYCCGTRKSHPRTRIIRQKRGSAEFLKKLFGSEGGISLSHNNTSYVLLWDKEIPPEDQNNSSETRLCRVSEEIIRVRGWDFLVPQQYIMMDTFSRPICDFLRFYMNSVSST